MPAIVKINVCFNKNVIGMFEQKGKSNKLEDIKPSSPLFECFWSCPLQVFLDQPSALHTGMVWYGCCGMVW